SVFSRRQCLTPYDNGKHALAGNGPYLELFNMESVYDGRHESVRHPLGNIRVFEKSQIVHILPLNETG
ncbi:hypothetical protein PFISCL1PPCAC_26766, partial [Pristionchus fissidentatus]